MKRADVCRRRASRVRQDVRVGVVVAGGERLHRLVRRGAETRRDRGGDPRLSDLGARSRDEDDHAWGTAPNTPASACSSRATCSSVCAADSVTRSRAVPGATVGGRIAGTYRPCSKSAAAAASARSSVPHTNGKMGDGCPGRRRSHEFAQARAQRVAFRGADDVEGGVRGRSVGRRRRGREDVGAGPVLQQLDIARGPGDEAAERAERLGEGPDAQHVVIARERGGGAEDRVRFIEHEQCFVAAGERGERVDIGGVAVHREDGVAHDHARAGRRACASSESRCSRSPWR